MRLYRIKEIAPNAFIPQTTTLFDYLISFSNLWLGIEGSMTWYTEENQKEYCTYSSLEKARTAIKKYKDLIEKPKIKYHKA